MSRRYSAHGPGRGGDHGGLHMDVGCTADNRGHCREAGRNLGDTADILRGDIRMTCLSEFRVRGKKDCQMSMVADTAQNSQTNSETGTIVGTPPVFVRGPPRAVGERPLADKRREHNVQATVGADNVRTVWVGTRNMAVRA